MRLKYVLAALAIAFGCSTGAHAQQNQAAPCACEIPNGTPNPHPYLIGYLGVYAPKDWATVVKTLDYTKMTHIDLAFINPPICQGPCTAKSDMTFGANKAFTDEALKTLIADAHAHGTKVLASLGGDGGDKNYMQFYNAGLSKEIVDALDVYLNKYGYDGVDVDIEQPTQMGVPYTQFVKALVAKLKPEGKLVTAAVAQYIQAGVEKEVLPMFDIVNVMIYGDYNRSVRDMAYWANQQHVPKEKLTLGIGFHNYTQVMANYPNAWKVDSVGGGTYRDGAVMSYQGETTVARITQLSRQYGGAMIWELSQDDPSKPHSLLKAMQVNLDPNAPPIPEPQRRRNGDE